MGDDVSMKYKYQFDNDEGPLCKGEVEAVNMDESVYVVASKLGFSLRDLRQKTCNWRLYIGQAFWGNVKYGTLQIEAVETEEGMSIQRWECGFEHIGGGSIPSMQPCKMGSYVGYADHASELAEAREQISTLTMQLAACGVGAMSNTEESKEKNRIAKDSPYYSASLQDVYNAVDREMSLREDDGWKSEILDEVKRTLAMYFPMEACPPMMYREAIINAVNGERIKVLKALGIPCDTDAERDACTDLMKERGGIGGIVAAELAALREKVDELQVIMDDDSAAHEEDVDQLLILRKKNKDHAAELAALRGERDKYREWWLDGQTAVLKAIGFQRPEDALPFTHDDGSWKKLSEMVAERMIAITAERDRLKAAVDGAVTVAPYGHFDGSHHKNWVIDQMLRSLLGDEYEQWVRNFKDGEDGPDTYDWDEGVAP